MCRSHKGARSPAKAMLSNSPSPYRSPRSSAGTSTAGLPLTSTSFMTDCLQQPPSLDFGFRKLRCRLGALNNAGTGSEMNLMIPDQQGPDQNAQIQIASIAQIAQRTRVMPSPAGFQDRKSTRLNSSHVAISY